MRYFLIVYDQRAGRLTRIDEFASDQAQEAMTRRMSLENEYLADPNVEVIVLTAADRAALEATHARYFKSIDEIAEDAGRS